MLGFFNIILQLSQTADFICIFSTMDSTCKHVHVFSSDNKKSRFSWRFLLDYLEVRSKSEQANLWLDEHVLGGRAEPVLVSVNVFCTV